MHSYLMHVWRLQVLLQVLIYRRVPIGGKSQDHRISRNTRSQTPIGEVIKPTLSRAYFGVVYIHPMVH
jgi:hypothetical protein